MKHDVKRLDQWFRRVHREFPKLVRPFAGRPIVYIEIGVWGGAASAYVCQHVLTHPDSIGYGIDPYNQAAERRRWDVEEIKHFARNRVHEIVGERYQWIYEPSSSGLLRLREILGDRKIDLLYIDGLHLAPDALSDFVLAWPMLHNGSRVIFDDYVKTRDQVWPYVRRACAAIEIAYRYRIRPVHRRIQYALDIIHHETPHMREQYKPPNIVYPDVAAPHLYSTGELQHGWPKLPQATDSAIS